jgi:hypothetical protein
MEKALIYKQTSDAAFIYSERTASNVLLHQGSADYSNIAALTANKTFVSPMIMIFLPMVLTDDKAFFNDKLE